MKHKPKIILIILLMFLVTQFIGLYVTNHYSSEENELPYFLETPQPEEQSGFYMIFTQILFAFIIAVVILFIITELKFKFLLKGWFFIVVALALGLTFNVIISDLFPSLKIASIIALIIGLGLSFSKIFGKNLIVHNITELLIYPGIASVFLPILNVVTVIVFLIIISVYDMWAVWKSGIMQKMAKYQMDKLKVFSGFMVPYISKKDREKIRKMKKMSKKKLKNKSIKINVAMLGGGDVVFPIITAGVMFNALGIYSSLLVIFGSLLGLTTLFLFSKKKKFYPAMPFITIGILIGIGLSYLIL
jgi:presenilin-like A22 family membrane protease